LDIGNHIYGLPNLFAWATGIGIVVLIAIRQGNRWNHKGRTSRFLGSVSWRAYYVEATILAIVICVIALYNLEQTNPTSEAIKVWATAKIVIINDLVHCDLFEFNHGRCLAPLPCLL